ncbi:glycosyl hydrolase family 28-related protein [Halomonas sp. V046]|uniref:glycosyl hydrolase family 28-related protein n=1 Tax=Halomonas sp. V046 TaxID=3459611 RepID=UPI004043CC3A
MNLSSPRDYADVSPTHSDDEHHSSLAAGLEDLARHFLAAASTLPMMMEDDSASHGASAPSAIGSSMTGPFDPLRAYAAGESFITDDRRWLVAVNNASTHSRSDRAFHLVFDFSRTPQATWATAAIVELARAAVTRAVEWTRTLPVGNEAEGANAAEATTSDVDIAQQGYPRRHFTTYRPEGIGALALSRRGRGRGQNLSPPPAPTRQRLTDRAGAASGLVEVGEAGAMMVTAQGSVVPRSLAERFADVINVKDFGASGDGVADDWAAINTAIATATLGQVVFFPSGEYLCKKPLVITKVVSLQGNGPLSSELVFETDGITIDSSSDTRRDAAVIRDLSFLTKAKGVYTGLTLISRGAAGPSPCKFFLQNLKFHGHDTRATPKNWYEWKTAIVMDSADKSVLNAIFIYGKERCSKDDYDTETVGIKALDCTGVVFSKVDVYRVKTGYVVSGHSEGDNWVDGVVVAANVGIHFKELVGPSNNFSIRGGHYACEQYGIWMEDVIHDTNGNPSISKYSNISNCFFLQRKCEGNRANNATNDALKGYCAIRMHTESTTIANVTMLTNFNGNVQAVTDDNAGIRLEGGSHNIVSNIVCHRSGTSVDASLARESIISNVKTRTDGVLPGQFETVRDGNNDVISLPATEGGLAIKAETILFDVKSGPVLKLTAGTGKNKAANRLEVLSSNNRTNTVTLKASSLDASQPDQDLMLQPTEGGRVKFGEFRSTSDNATVGFIEIKDADGNMRKLAVIA